VRLRPGASKAPLAVAGILAVPLFLVGLMAFALKLEKPTHHLTTKGKLAFGDPTKGTLGEIYLLALAVALGVVVVGFLASLLWSRLAAVVPAAAAVVATALLLIPLGTWAAGHTARFPQGTDNIPDKSAQNLTLRGEWEQSAETTARQIGFVTIGLAAAAILLSLTLEFRRRRGIVAPAVPPPPAVSGVAEASPVVELDVADSDLARGQRPGRWRWR
jgi:hypothetical protein